MLHGVSVILSYIYEKSVRLGGFFVRAWDVGLFFSSFPRGGKDGGIWPSAERNRCHWIPDRVGNDEKKGGSSGMTKKGNSRMTGEGRSFVYKASGRVEWGVTGFPIRSGMTKKRGDVGNDERGKSRMTKKGRAEMTKEAVVKRPPAGWILFYWVSRVIGIIRPPAERNGA